MFSVIGAWSNTKIAYWDGKNFAKPDENRRKLKTERAAIAVARKLRKQQDLAIEIVDESLAKTTRIIVVKNGEVYTALPKEWKQLEAEGYGR